MLATSPDGTRYRLRRRWLPWRWHRRVSGRPLRLNLAPDLDLFEGLPAFLASIAFSLFVVVLVPIVFLVLLTGIEWLLLLIVLPIAAVWRLLFGRHWHIEVRHGRRLVAEYDGGRWDSSGKLIEDLADRIRRGERFEVEEPEDRSRPVV